MHVWVSSETLMHAPHDHRLARVCISAAGRIWVELRISCASSGVYKDWQASGSMRVHPAVRTLIRRPSLQQGAHLGVLLLVAGIGLLPLLLGSGALLAGLSEELVHLGGHLKLAVVPLEVGASRGGLVLAQRRTVHVVGVRLVG